MSRIMKNVGFGGIVLGASIWFEHLVPRGPIGLITPTQLTGSALFMYSTMAIIALPYEAALATAPKSRVCGRVMVGGAVAHIIACRFYYKFDREYATIIQN
jgi:hypothetical protein